MGLRRRVLLGMAGRSRGRSLIDLMPLLAESPDGLEIVLDGPESLHRSMSVWRSGAAEPRVEVRFRLRDSGLDDGVYTFESGSWSFAFDLAAGGFAERLDEIAGPTLAVLKLQPTPGIADDSEAAAQAVRPVLTIVGPA